jgi:DNA-binding transcriptional LysR family regulator
MSKPHEPLPIYPSSAHSIARLLFSQRQRRAAKELADGSLVPVLEDWCQPFAGYHLYYPNRREHSSAFGVVVDALLYKR